MIPILATACFAGVLLASIHFTLKYALSPKRESLGERVAHLAILALGVWSGLLWGYGWIVVMLWGGLCWAGSRAGEA